MRAVMECSGKGVAAIRQLKVISSVNRLFESKVV